VWGTTGAAARTLSAKSAEIQTDLRKLHGALAVAACILRLVHRCVNSPASALFPYPTGKYSRLSPLMLKWVKISDPHSDTIPVASYPD
jgi:hypothetical protein